LSREREAALLAEETLRRRQRGQRATAVAKRERGWDVHSKGV
jgi:hypothetical protein